MYDTLQLLFLATHYENNTHDYNDEFPLYKVPQYITRKKHHSHDNYLYRRWNNLTARKPKKKTQTTHQHLPAHDTAKDDQSVTPTLKTLCTTDTRSSHQTTIAPSTILNATIWKIIVQYRMPIQPLARTRNRSREHPNTAVQYALIGVYDKLLHPPKFPCLSSTFTSITFVVLFCFLSLAASFTMAKWFY